MHELLGAQKEDHSSSDLKRFFKEEVGVVKEMAIGALRPKERKEGKGGEKGKVMVRVIELDWNYEFKSLLTFLRTMRSVEIEEHEVG